MDRVQAPPQQGCELKADQDRILDERTGVKYVIDADSFMANPAMAADIRLDARRTT